MGRILDRKEYNSRLIFGYGATAAPIPVLAKCCGVSASTMHRYKQDPDKIPTGVLLKLKRLRNVDLGRLT